MNVPWLCKKLTKEAVGTVYRNLALSWQFSINAQLFKYNNFKK